MRGTMKPYHCAFHSSGLTSFQICLTTIFVMSLINTGRVHALHSRSSEPGANENQFRNFHAIERRVLYF